MKARTVYVEIFDIELCRCFRSWIWTYDLYTVVYLKNQNLEIAFLFSLREQYQVTDSYGRVGDLGSMRAILESRLDECFSCNRAHYVSNLRAQTLLQHGDLNRTAVFHLLGIFN